MNWIRWAVHPSSETSFKVYVKQPQAWVTTGVEDVEIGTYEGRNVFSSSFISFIVLINLKPEYDPVPHRPMFFVIYC